MNYNEWENAIPETIKADSLWKMKAYRTALFLGDVSWRDVTKQAQDHRTLALSDQLYRSAGSISANLAEGYSLGTGKNRARYYEYALGSARESRDWYFKGRHVLDDLVVTHRMEFLAEIIRLLLTMIPQQRDHAIREETEIYRTDYENAQTNEDGDLSDFSNLLENVPLPQ